MMQSLLSIRKQNAENPELDDEHMASVQAVGVIAIGNMCLIFEEFNKQGYFLEFSVYPLRLSLNCDSCEFLTYIN